MLATLKDKLKLVLPKYQKLVLEYKVDLKPRYEGSKPHKLLYDIINRNRDNYESLIAEILKNQETFYAIKPADKEVDENLPAWNNGFFPGLDVVALYSIIKKYNPKNYIEVGSGNSTKVAKKVITDNNLQTLITSIDPFPRANIDHLADKVIRSPLENIADNNFISDELHENDILFIDNSHRVLPNSDAMVTFLELLPALRKGVIVHIHDIYLPYDYPQFMCDRFYSEQYMLAAFVLANPKKYKTIFPCYFVSEDKALSQQLASLWDSPNTNNVEKQGGSYWLQIQ
jgi:hypothetical protein